jgi:4-diphosphocytidyl-2-C-methyl-D-erythritol kinase
LPVDERNLVYKIIDYMRSTYGIKEGVFVNLYKIIPVAAGLAGGSSDGAQTILGMNQLFELKLSMEEMLLIGSKFGSDIPYCMIQGSALARGLGEKITLLDPFPELYVLIVKPRFSMSTALVYNHFDLSKVSKHPDTQKVIEAIKNQQVDTICHSLENVLETVTPFLHPEINEIKKLLLKLQAKGVLMSGSGPSVYGLYDNKKYAEKALNAIKKENKMQFAYLTTIYNRKKG